MKRTRSLNKENKQSKDSKKITGASANTWFAVCSSQRHTAKGLFAVRYAQSRTAKHLPPINLERGKIWPLFAVRFAIHAWQRDFPPMQKYFPRIIGDPRQSFESWSTSLPCGMLCRVPSVCCAVHCFFAVRSSSAVP